MTREGLPRTVLVLAGTHLVIDAYANIYAPLLPLFIPRLRLSLAAAGTIAMALQLAGSVSQLVFGHLADRWRPRVLLTVGPVVSVICLSLAGLATTPLGLAVILIVGNLGSAAFHPAAAAVVTKVGGVRRGLAMSVHVTGGSVGNAIAPVMFAAYAQRFGLTATPLLMVPGLALLSGILRRVPDVTLSGQGETPGLRALRPYAVPLALLWTIVVIRTLVALSFATFLPVLMTRRGLSVSEAGAAVTLYLLSGSSGVLVGGPMADRFGPRRVIAWSLLLAVPLLAMAPRLTGPAFFAALTAGGFLLGSTLPVNVTFAHMIAPVSTGTVSSLMLGVAWGTGGLSVPLVGMFGDLVGVETTLSFVGLLPLLAAALTVPLRHR